MKLDPEQRRALKWLQDKERKKRMHVVRFRYIAALIVALLLLFLCGCTTTPGMFPREHGPTSARCM